MHNKAEANNDTSELVAKLEQLREKIAQDKNSIEVKLNFKERECELLSKMQGKDETVIQPAFLSNTGEEKEQDKEIKRGATKEAM